MNVESTSYTNWGLPSNESRMSKSHPKVIEVNPKNVNTQGKSLQNLQKWTGISGMKMSGAKTFFFGVFDPLMSRFSGKKPCKN